MNQTKYTPEQVQSAIKTLQSAGDNQSVGVLQDYLQGINATAFNNGADVQQNNTAQDFLGGAKHAWDKAAYGLAETMDGLVPDEWKSDSESALAFPDAQTRKKRLDQGSSFVDKASGAADVGEIAGDIGIAIAPGTAAYKGIKAISQANALRALPKSLNSLGQVAGNAAANAGVAAAIAPENKKEAAVLAGTLGAAADGVAGVYKLAAKGLPAQSLKIKPHAQFLMDQGVNVPLYKAAQSKFITNFGETVRGFPIAGPMMRGQDDAMLRSYNEYLAKQAMPENVPIKDVDTGVTKWVQNDVDLSATENLVDALKTQFDDAYDEVFKGRDIPLSKSGVYDVQRETDELLTKAKQFHSTPAAEATEAIAPIMKALTRDAKGRTEVVESMLINPRTGKPMEKSVTQVPGNNMVPASVMSEMLDTARKVQVDLKSQGKHLASQIVGDFLNILRNARMQGVPEDVAPQLRSLNQRYGKFKVLEKAMGSTGANSARMVTPGHMMAALRSMDSSKDKAKFARDGMRWQGDIKKDMDVVGNRLPLVGPGTAEKLGALNTLTNPSLMRTMMEVGMGNFNKLATGTTGIQGKMARPLDSQGALARALRAGYRAMPVGVSQSQQ